MLQSEFPKTKSGEEARQGLYSVPTVLYTPHYYFCTQIKSTLREPDYLKFSICKISLPHSVFGPEVDIACSSSEVSGLLFSPFSFSVVDKWAFGDLNIVKWSSQHTPQSCQNLTDLLVFWSRLSATR